MMSHRVCKNCGTYNKKKSLQLKTNCIAIESGIEQFDVVWSLIFYEKDLQKILG